MALSSKDYTKQGGVKCPNCKSEDIEGFDVDVDFGTASQPVTCNDCGADWVDIYNLVGYEDLFVSIDKVKGD